MRRREGVESQRLVKLVTALMLYRRSWTKLYAKENVPSALFGNNLLTC